MKNNNKKNTGILWSITKGSRMLFLFGILCAGLCSLLDMFIPDVIRMTVDSIIGDKALMVPGYLFMFRNMTAAETAEIVTLVRSRLWIIAIIVGVLALLSALANYGQTTLNEMASEHMTKNMRDRLFTQLQDLSFSWHNKNHTGDIIQRCTTDVETVRRFVSEQLFSVVRIILLMCISLIFMFRLNSTLTWIVMATMPVIFVYSWVFGAKISKKYMECDECEGVLSSICQENLTGIRVVRAFGRERYERERFQRQNQSLVDRYMDLNIWSVLFWCIGDFMSGLQVMVVLALGTVFTVRGHMTVGELLAYISYNALLSWPIRDLARVISDMSKAGVSIERVCYILGSETETSPDDPVMPDMHGDIEFRNVTFAYPEGKNVLDNVSFTVKQGTVFGIMGATGSGKSTIVELLDRMFDLEEGNGSITISGTDIRNIPRNWVRANIGLVLQEPFLFAGSIKGNIGITQEELDMGMIENAAEIADIDRTIKNFSKGYSTIVGERGVTLSGGQMQRVAIARMLVRQTPIMILDDSLSAVDSVTDARIREALGRKFKGATVIIISHRIKSIEDADTVMVLDGGKVAEIGTPAELEKAGGIYKKTLDIQSNIE
ncbi:MAG: ABC transporter ATP-binding protein [Oscillospiraceae bacterium]|nr:ABC transporter ATP-binding protein [Oscillospiraceae bacterium]